MLNPPNALFIVEHSIRSLPLAVLHWVPPSCSHQATIIIDLKFRCCISKSNSCYSKVVGHSLTAPFCTREAGPCTSEAELCNGEAELCNREAGPCTSEAELCNGEGELCNAKGELCNSKAEPCNAKAEMRKTSALSRKPEALPRFAVLL